MRRHSATPPLFSHTSLDRPPPPVIELSDPCQTVSMPLLDSFRSASGPLPDGFRAGGGQGPQERSLGLARRQGRGGLSPKPNTSAQGTGVWAGAAAPTTGNGRFPTIGLPRGAVFCPQAAPLSNPVAMPMWHQPVAQRAFSGQPLG